MNMKKETVFKERGQAELNETDTLDPEDDDKIQFKDLAAWGHGQSQEECERQLEECGSILGPWTFLVVIPDAQGDGAPWPVLVMLCMAGMLQPPVVTPGEHATLFKVEAGEDGETQLDAVVAGTGWGFQLLAEDIIEDVEVVADEEQQQGSSQELEEKTVEEQSQERPGGPSELPALDVLQALATPQVELSSELEKNLRAYVWFMCKSHHRRKHDLAQKNAIIQGIPDFWAKMGIGDITPLQPICSGTLNREHQLQAGHQEP
ncbi:hypothetical protein MG293_020836 [Ovis ammon polii]|uniref:Uncharacterized protein n=1 Tax=Ovis ammon polii TaxID=230172 RepID=A0AAD4TMH2_OVIAM|nr:hypothetical protein MG293_020836 [Ovis ammon polii]